MSPRLKVRSEAKKRTGPPPAYVRPVPKWLMWAYVGSTPRHRTTEQLHDLERDFASGARVIASGTLKMLFLINGGAIVLIVGLIGNLWRGTRSVDISGASASVGFFGTAVGLWGLAAVLGWGAKRCSAEYYRYLRLHARGGGFATVGELLGVAMGLAVLAHSSHRGPALTPGYVRSTRWRAQSSDQDLGAGDNWLARVSRLPRYLQ